MTWPGKYATCEHPNNRKVEYGWLHSWERPHVKEPYEINRHNDCNWFSTNESGWKHTYPGLVKGLWFLGSVVTAVLLTVGGILCLS